MDIFRSPMAGTKRKSTKDIKNIKDKCEDKPSTLSLWCGVAQLVARRPAGRQARVWFPARHQREVCPTELTTDDEEMEGSEQNEG